MNEDQIVALLQRIGLSMSANDVQGVASCWEVPALVLSYEGVMAVTDRDQIETFFAQAIEWYRSQGVVTTRPELERIDMLSEKLASVDVRWPAFDASGAEMSTERSHYLVQLGQDGQVRIRAALTRTR